MFTDFIVTPILRAPLRRKLLCLRQTVYVYPSVEIRWSLLCCLLLLYMKVNTTWAMPEKVSEATSRVWSTQCRAEKCRLDPLGPFCKIEKNLLTFWSSANLCLRFLVLNKNTLYRQKNQNRLHLLIFKFRYFLFHCHKFTKSIT